MASHAIEWGGLPLLYLLNKVFPTTSDLDAWHKQRHASRFFNTKKKEPLGRVVARIIKDGLQT